MYMSCEFYSAKLLALIRMLIMQKEIVHKSTYRTSLGEINVSRQMKLKRKTLVWVKREFHKQMCERKNKWKKDEVQKKMRGMTILFSLGR